MGWFGGRAGNLAMNDVLIVIPCLNEVDVLADVVARILDDERLVQARLVIADGGSTDGTQRVARRLADGDGRVQVIDNPGRLQSAGVNLAARQAGTDAQWLVRVDAHAGYPRNYVSSLIDEARRTQAASVVVSMETRGTAWFQCAVAAAQNSPLGTGGAAHRSGGREGWVDHGHHALFRLADFLAIGGYDETFSHNEDAEFDLRLARHGGKIWHTNQVRIVYFPRTTPIALAKQYFNYGMGRARTVFKHSARLKVRQALPLAVAPAVILACAAPLFWPAAIPGLAWLVAVLAFGLASGLAKRDPAVMASGAPAAIMHLAWSAGFWREAIRRATTGRAKLQPPQPRDTLT